MPLSARRGHLLAEALCALALSALLAVAAASALGGARRALGAAERRARAERAGREALLVVSALVRDADSIVVLGDTALELSVLVAIGVVCHRDSTTLTMPPATTTSGRPLTLRAQPIEPGDEVTVLVRDGVRGLARWERSVVDSAADRWGGSSCGVAGGFVEAADAGAARVRLVLNSLGPAVGPGAPVRVDRRGRIVLYYAGGGEWMLGWRRCGAGTCGVVQPVAGPLRSPAAGGFRVSTDVVAGTVALSVRVPGIEAPLEAVVPRRDARR